jgi:hypothetical protein
MSRDPTAGEIENLRHLLAEAGSVAELRRWIKLARSAPAKVQRKQGRRKGVSTYTGDTTLLLHAAALQKHHPELKRFEAIKEVVETQWCLWRWFDALPPARERKVASPAPMYIHRYVAGGPQVVLKSIKPGNYRQTIFGLNQHAHAKRLLEKLGGRSLAQFRDENCADPKQSVADKYAVEVIDTHPPRFLPGTGWMWGFTRLNLREKPQEHIGVVVDPAAYLHRTKSSFDDRLVLPTETKPPKRSVLIIRRQGILTEATASARSVIPVADIGRRQEAKRADQAKGHGEALRRQRQDG